MTATEQQPPTFTDHALGGDSPYQPDPDLDDFDRDGEDDLDPLAALTELAAPVVMPEVVLPHRFRAGWAVRYSTELDADDLERWRKRAKRPGKAGMRGEIDEIRLACILLANLSKGLERNGAPVLDEERRPLTFAHTKVWEIYGAARAADAVRKFYGNDPYLLATLEAVLAAAGVGEEVEPLDPTMLSGD